PLTQKHKWALPAAAVAEYAGEKGKFWELTLTVMGLNRELASIDELYAAAKGVGLNDADLAKRLSNPKDEAYVRVAKDEEMANEIGIKYTPTFILLDA